MWGIEQDVKCWMPKSVLRALCGVTKYSSGKVNYKFYYNFFSKFEKQNNDIRWIISTVYREKYNYEISISDE